MVEVGDIQHVNKLESNFRSDVVAAGMVDVGIDADKIVILRRQGNARQTDKEIHSIEYKRDFEGNKRDAWIIKTNRQGIYDNLPEGLFHDFTGLNDNSKESIIHSFRLQSIQERWIRRFFSLYEVELDRTRIDIQLEEYRYDRPDKNRAFVDTLSPFWPVIKEMDARTAKLFIHTIPLISEIRGSYSKISEALSFITGYSVRIESCIFHMPQTHSVRLGDMRLGSNSVLKGTSDVTFLKVIVTPDKDSIIDLVEGKTKYNILKVLLDIFMPVNMDNQLVIAPQKQDCTSKLGDKTNPCILGINGKLRE